jgi:WD40 repeat protein
MYQQTNVAEVIIWDVATMKEKHRLRGANAWVYQARFSPDGETLAASGGDGVVTLWTVATGDMMARLPGHNGFVEPIDFSPDGEILAAGDQQGHVWLWNWKARRVETVFHAHDLPIYTVVFSPDQKRLITVSRDHTARMWDLKTRREIARFAGHVGGVTGAKLHPDGQTLVTASQDGSIKFWDMRNLLPDGLLGTHTEIDAQIKFTSNGHFLARIERRKEQIVFFHTETGAEVKSLSGQEVSASQDGKLLSVVRGSRLTFLNPVTLAETSSIDAGAPLGSSAISPDGKLIAVRRRDSAGSHVVVFDSEQQREVTVFSTGDEIWAPLLFARGGTLLLTAGKRATAISAWDTRSGRKTASYEDFEWKEPRNISALAVSPDGRTIAASGKTAVVLLWSVDEPTNPMTLNTGAGDAYSAAFSPDGKTLAIGAIDSTIRLWNVAARQEVAALSGHSSYINSIAFAPDGRTLSSLSLDKTLRVWRAPSFDEIVRAEKEPTRAPDRE